jgi:uncharacterized protein YbjT (DUF2867 family)
MIAVVGATGTLGRQLVPVLQGRGLAIRVVTRDAAAARAKLPDVEVVEADVNRPDDARRAVAGAATVISAITGFATAGVCGVDAEANRTLAHAAKEGGVAHLVLLSVAGAAPDHPIPLFRAKHAAEQSVRATGLPYTFIRPTAHLETWLGLVGGPLLATGKTRLFGRGRNPINLVSAADVARYVANATTDETLRGRTLEVPGPENLTLEDLVAVIRRVTGAGGRVTHAPLPMLRLMSVALRPVNRTLADLIRTAVAMDTRDMTMDGPAIRAAFPDIPMTTAQEIAHRLFAPVSRPAAPNVHGAPASP